MQDKQIDISKLTAYRLKICGKQTITLSELKRIFPQREIYFGDDMHKVYFGNYIKLGTISHMLAFKEFLVMGINSIGYRESIKPIECMSEVGFIIGDELKEFYNNSLTGLIKRTLGFKFTTGNESDFVITKNDGNVLTLNYNNRVLVTPELTISDDKFADGVDVVLINDENTCGYEAHYVEDSYVCDISHCLTIDHYIRNNRFDDMDIVVRYAGLKSSTRVREYHEENDLIVDTLTGERLFIKDDDVYLGYKVGDLPKNVVIEDDVGGGLFEVSFTQDSCVRKFYTYLIDEND